jgi:hypothetical protein
MTRPERLIGTREGVLTQEHRRRMGPARLLFDWLVARQTASRNGTGLVLRGAPITYARIQSETGYPRRSLQRWMQRLVREGYIEVQHAHYCRMIVGIPKQKKFKPKQGEMRFPQISTDFHRSKCARSGAPGAPEVAHSIRGLGLSDKLQKITTKRPALVIERKPEEQSPMTSEQWREFRGLLGRVAAGRNF